jgi:hypothetical protein
MRNGRAKDRQRDQRNSTRVIETAAAISLQRVRLRTVVALQLQGIDASRRERDFFQARTRDK